MQDEKPHSKFSSLVDMVYQTPDCRFKREETFTCIVIHHTGNSLIGSAGWKKTAESVTKWLTTDDGNYASAHFQINPDGQLVQLCDPKLYEAFHAGKSEHWHQDLRRVVKDWNRYSIGIELLGDGNKHPYTPEQYQKLIAITCELMQAFPISIKNILGHEEISPGRKVDPGVYFDWDNFLRSVFITST